jgi:hypothetical protein
MKLLLNNLVNNIKDIKWALALASSEMPFKTRTCEGALVTRQATSGLDPIFSFLYAGISRTVHIIPNPPLKSTTISSINGLA